jgi:hypothetical protein
MTTAAIPTHPYGRGRLATGIVAATAGALIGVLGTATFDGQASNVQPIAPHRSVSGQLLLTADAAEHWLKTGRPISQVPCRPDAAQRWQIPTIAVADLPHTADAAEHWLTPEIAVADLPNSADAAEHWLCAP